MPESRVSQSVCPNCGAPRVPKITHGRHCTCSSCAREDWENPDLAPCGMHGSVCPALYQPWGRAGDPVPAEPPGILLDADLHREPYE